MIAKRYAKARDVLARTERRLVTAQNSWQKARATIRRLEKELDKKIGAP